MTRNHGGGSSSSSSSSSSNDLLAGVAALGITVTVVAVGTAMVVCRRRVKAEEKRGSFDWLQQAGIERIPKHKAGMFELNDLDRSPLGNVGGAGALRCSDTGCNASVKNLADVPGLLLYAIEILQKEVLLVFLQVPSVPEALATPFLDRGVRALAATGSTVYVARLEAVEKIPGFVPAHKLSPDLQARFSFVWNTGRCGSTLMHKMLQKLGVLSFSEPYWLDNIIQLPFHGIGHDAIGRIFGVCAAMDIFLARRTLPAHAPVFGAPSTLGAGHISFNLKGNGFSAMEPIMKALPNARHLLMYRDVRKVIESFGSIFQKDQSRLEKMFGVLNPWRRPEAAKGKRSPPKEGVDAPIFSGAVEKVLASGDLVRPSKPLVSRLSIHWMQTLCLWEELLQTGVAKKGSTASLRMEDFTRKDPELIEGTLRFFFGDNIEVGEDAIATSLEAFNTHSQAGNLMANSSHNSGSGKARFLSSTDVREIERVTAAVPAIGSPEYTVPGSLGAPVPE